MLCPPFEHSVPFGNWGVDSIWGSRTNGDQFAGWKDENGQQQWNSCTYERPAPDPNHYNEDMWTTQRTDVGWRTVAGIPFLFEGIGCEVFDNYPITVQGVWMNLYELDGCDEDEYVATMTYNELNALAHCSGYQETSWCTSSGGAYLPSSVGPAGVVTAYATVGAGAYWGEW